MLPKVSIILPVYNVAEYIVPCIESIYSQDYVGPIELIVIDDCGSDSSMDKLREYISIKNSVNIDVRIICHSENKGLSAARNTGVKEASGKYVLFVDSDDRIVPSAISILVDTMIETCADVVGGQDIRTFIHCDPQISSNYDDADLIYQDNYDIWYNLYSGWCPVAWNKLIDIDFIRKNELYFPEGIYYEDLYWAFNIALHAKKIVVIPHTTYLYTNRSGSITHRVTTAHVDSFAGLICLLHDRILSASLMENRYWPLIVAKYEHVRNLSLDNIVPYIDEDETARFIDAIKGTNITSVVRMWSNPYMSMKSKLKNMAFRLGRFNVRYIYIKAKISKRIWKIIRK